MQIDVASVLESRAPRVARLMPRWLVRKLEEAVCQDRMNRILTTLDGLKGVDFAEGVLKELSISYDIAGADFDPANRHVIFVSNHPLGGLDGLVLSSMVRRLYHGDGTMKFVVNDLLTYIEPLRDIFVGVNKHGAQSREAAAAIDGAFDSDVPLLMFPAGLCSRRGKDGVVADLQWKTMVVKRAISSHRDIIPVHFSGENSSFFYKFARLRTRLGLKFNIEMLRLPRELFYNEGARFTVTLGQPIGWQTLKGGKELQTTADSLRQAVYNLSKQP